MLTKQKVAIGASQGIGASLVKAFRKCGYAVVAHSRYVSYSDGQRQPAS
jgi:short-subunit dehydrogenase